jgi:hypothetical protein
LLERLPHPTRTPGGDGTVESFLRGIEVVHDEQRLAASLGERHRGHGPTVTTFLVLRPGAAFWWTLVAVGVALWMATDRSWKSFGFSVPDGWRLWASLASFLG